MAERSVLVIEDEENLLEALRYNLEREGYRVHTATDGGEGLELARKVDPSLVLLDIMLPTLDGFEICRILRRESEVPILMLTARGEEVDRVVGLELGADDYITKPFSIRELVARVRNTLRRTRYLQDNRGLGEEQSYRVGNLEMDLNSHEVRLAGEPLYLKPKEFDLLALMIANKGRALTRDQILEKVWGYDYIGQTRTVDVYISWLREKLQADPSTAQSIVTIRGVGYRLDG
ncbi:MAG: response regulator transcription factor [Chloroflexota bacterium]|nr:response regulator transcription factor [Chloroflexota bacterium]